jgi:hypothetical protein
VPRYDAAFWADVIAGAGTRRLMGTLKRIVENQAQKVTLALTDNLAEHELLEELLEASKPKSAHPRLDRLDYLLRTPWRYPPLPWGSRFGRRFEPSLFYGALETRALFAEAAYYRFVFLEGMARPFRERVISQFTVFDAMYRTERGMDLSQPPFDEYEKILRHPGDYGPCQALGSLLRERGIEAILYLSARTRDDALNIALYSPDALRSRKHRNPRAGVCESRAEQVSFGFAGALYAFPREVFLVDGALPVPA